MGGTVRSPVMYSNFGGHCNAVLRPRLQEVGRPDGAAGRSVASCCAAAGPSTCKAASGATLSMWSMVAYRTAGVRAA